MNDNKGQTIFLSVIGIATLLVAIVGATFAWFSATINNPDVLSNSVIITTASLGTITFENGTEINAINIYPGWEATKEVSLTSDANSTVEIPYYIDLNITENTFVDEGETYGYIQYYYEVTTSAGGEATAITKENVVDIKAETDKVQLLSKMGVLPAAEIPEGSTEKVGQTHTYIFHFIFPELGSNQNSQQGKSFTGYLSARTSADTGYTWDNSNNTYSVYTSSSTSN